MKLVPLKDGFLLVTLTVSLAFAANKGPYSLSPMQSGDTTYALPHLQKRGQFTRLIVRNKPLLMVGGELGDSSASDLAPDQINTGFDRLATGEAIR